jgi:nucleotide-binding universal stress UspA family protein
MARFQTILVATDGTDDSDGAVDAALDLAHDTGASLLVLTVVPEGTTDSEADDGEPPGRRSSPDGEDDSIAEAEERTDTILDHATEWGIDARTIIWEGEPGEAIVAAAQSESADVIVIGTNGRGGMGRMFSGGSTSDHVIRHAPVPVMVVRNQRERE